MTFELLGNQEAKESLKKAASKDRVGHAWLFTGPSGVGKSFFAYDFAAQLVSRDNTLAYKKAHAKQHPDIHLYQPEGKLGLHSMASMRQFAQEVTLPPHEAPVKVFIVQDADRMLTYSANALLKTFEEPAERTVILLTSSEPHALLPTLLSRCRTVRFCPVEQDLLIEYLMRTQNLDAKRAYEIAKKSKGSFGVAMERVRQGGEEPKTACLLDLLASNQHGHYLALEETLNKIHQLVEDEKKTIEKGCLEKAPPQKELSLAYREQLEQEVQGAVSTKIQKGLYNLLEVILEWYRDAHLLAAGGGEGNLFFSEFASSLRSGSYHRIPLEKVIREVEKAKSALSRSVRFVVVFQHLLSTLAKQV